MNKSLKSAVLILFSFFYSSSIFPINGGSGIELLTLDNKALLDHVDKLIDDQDYDSAQFYFNILDSRFDEGKLLVVDKLTQFYHQARMNHHKGNYMSCVHFSNAYTQLLEIKNEPHHAEAQVYVYLGLAYYFLDQLGLSIDAHFNAMKAYKERHDEFGVILCYYNIGKSYDDLGNFDKSTQYINLAIQGLKKDQKHMDRLSGWYSYMASVQLSNKNTRAAKNYLDSALTASKKHENTDFLSSIHRYYGKVHYAEGNVKQAIKSLNLAIKYGKEQRSETSNIENMIALANIYNRTSNQIKTIELLEPYLKEQLSKNTYQTRLKTLKEELYMAYTDLGKYKKAINLVSDFEYLADSIQKLDMVNQVQQAEIRAHAANQSAENELLKKKDELNQQTIKTQNTMLISSVIVLILVVAIAIIVYRAAVINKRLSKKNKAQADRLIQLDAAKSRFFANISHDLRTPMTLIMGGIQQVLENKDVYLNSRAEKQLMIGLKNGERILHLTNEINELIKLEDNKLAIKPKYIDINEVLNLFVQMFSSMAEMRGVHLAYSSTIIEGGSIVHVDPFHFEKVLFNLITNGLKHTQEKGSLTVSLRKIDTSLCVSILDTGEGIPEENIPYIFDRYYQAPETTFKTQEGFGIGLALVKEIIDKHHAKIEVKSRVGIGTEFIIYLKQERVGIDQVTNLSQLLYSDQKRDLFRDIEDTVEAKPTVHIDSIRNKSKDVKNKTILIVEDHPEVRDYIYDIISEHYTVLTASNGQRALKILAKEPVDLIITDLMMPWFDGFELLEQLRQDEKLKKIPALVLSARTSEEDKEKVLMKGVNDFLSKPFQPKELLLRVENLLNQKEWNNANENALFINSQETIDEVEASLLKKVENLILERIDDSNLSITFLAKEICVSERKFYRFIKKLTNATPYEYIKEVRLQYANRIIREKKLSNSSELARMIGMNNVSHFNTQFKKRFGKKPTDLLQKT
ncbi:Signal transduction histidine kinase [Reichenbachiella agariperforans]|uniref:histidine kinase n=2 Tax=Reichenbachiella agariperforans TaxID=156994 RepID=A0A1M6J605_REIAG|nr:Signal transduction histidine kinase [Reichenbachiella agariperforans]